MSNPGLKEIPKPTIFAKKATTYSPLLHTNQLNESTTLQYYYNNNVNTNFISYTQS
jgi:hypothetical protein